MADLYNWYTGQPVTAQEMRNADIALEAGQKHLITDLGFGGVHEGLAVVQHAGTQNLTVDVAPGLAYSPEGERILSAITTNVDCSFDYLGNPTTVTTPGDSRFLDLYAVFDRVPSDPRLDATNTSVYFKQSESYGFDVVQGASAVFPSAPGVLADGVLIARIKISFGTTQILNAAIDTSTAIVGYYIHISGSPLEIVATSVVDAFQQETDAFNGHVTGAAYRHLASHIDFGGSATWADGTTNPAASVEAQLDKIITNLTTTGSGVGGTQRIGGATLASVHGSGTDIAAGTLRAQLLALKDAGNIDANTMSTWRNGRANPPASVQVQLSKLVDDLGAQTTGDDGAERIGVAILASWLGGRANPVSDVNTALNKIINDLGAQTTADDGAERIGAAATTSTEIAAGSVSSQIQALATSWAKLSRANTFTNTQTLDGFTGAPSTLTDSINAPIYTTTTSTAGVDHRRLLWYIAGNTAGAIRFYDCYGIGLQISVNAQWIAAFGQWVRDIPSGPNSLLMTIAEGNTTIKHLAPGGAGNFNTTDFDADSWTFQHGTGDRFISAAGLITAPGGITVRCSGCTLTPASSALPVGSGTTFPKLFPTTPSSITITEVAHAFVINSPVASQVTSWGLTVKDTSSTIGSQQISTYDADVSVS